MRPLLMTKAKRTLAEKLMDQSAEAAFARKNGRKAVTTEYTMVQIAARLEVSVPTLYAWFPGGIRGRVQALEAASKKASRKRKAA